MTESDAIFYRGRDQRYQAPASRLEKRRGLFVANIFRRGKDEQEHASQDPTGLKIEQPPKELLTPDAHLLADVLLHNPENPMPLKDIREIMRWARHDSVWGHVYQLESSHPELYRPNNRESAYIKYYLGKQDDEGNETEPKDSIFPKAINKKGTMIASARLRASGVPYIHSKEAMELERFIVAPELHDKRIGTGFGISVCDEALYGYTGYNGLPAKELRLSVIVDVSNPIAALELFDSLGFKPHGGPRKISTRWIQPMRVFRQEFKHARERALGELGIRQPDWAVHLESIWPDLQDSLAARIQSARDGTAD